MARLSVPRGGVESFYVVVRPKVGAKIEASLARLSSTSAELDASRIRLSQVLFADAPNGRVADIVVPLPEGGIVARSGENLPLLIELSVPVNQAPGIYEGVVEVRIDGAAAQPVPVRLKVLRASIPATASLPTAFGFDGRGAWMLHGGDLQARRTVAQRYAKSALSHRVSLVGGSGLSPGPKAIAPGEGWLELDFSEFDREMAPLMDGVAELGGASSTAVAIKTPGNLTQMERFKYVLSVRKHLRAKGWSRALVLVDGVPVFARDDGRSAQIIMECEGVSACRTLGGEQRPWWRLSVRGGADEPSLAVGADPARLRAIGWTAFEMNAAGLRVDDASEGFTDAAVGGPTGPGALFYPPRSAGEGHDAPVESVRLKVLRDALEDYELLLLADGARRDRARQFLGELTPSVPEGARMDALRELLDGDEPSSEAPQARR